MPPVVESANANSSTSLFDSECIIITVGTWDKKQEFTIHKRILCEKSEFFVKALDGSFAEATTNTIAFPEDDPKLFEQCLHYFYSSKLPVSSDGYLRSIIGHIDLFILADKLLLPQLQQMCLSYIRHHYAMHWLPSVAVLKKVCAPEFSIPKLREYFVQSFSYFILFTQIFHTQWDELLNVNEGFALEVLMDIIRRTRNSGTKLWKEHPFVDEDYLSFAVNNELVSAQEAGSF